jgi:hypothetical protein
MSFFGHSKAAVRFCVLILLPCASNLCRPLIAAPMQTNPPKLSILGTVLQENGLAPPFRSGIELNCGEGFKKVTETSSSGAFNFHVDPSYKTLDFVVNAERNYAKEAIFPDFVDSRQLPEQQSSKGESRPSRCEIRAHLAGYRSSTATVLMDEAKNIFDVGAIILYSNSKTGSAVVKVIKYSKPGKKPSKQ